MKYHLFLTFSFLLLLIACNFPPLDEAEEEGPTEEEVELDHELLNSFYATYGGRNTFPENEALALETLILAQEDLEAGRLEEAKERVDRVFSALPLSNPIWQSISSNSHCSGCPINIGSPAAYYGLRMLQQIIDLGDPKGSASLTMTVVVAPCAKVSRPTLPNLSPETEDLTIAPEILADDGRILHQSTALFRRWVQAITGGLSVDLVVYTLQDCTTVDYTDDGSTIVSYPDAQAMVDAVSDEVAAATDFWWVIAPSGVPGDGSGYGRHFITGGMGGYGPGLPLFLSDDAWFIRKPEHLGKGTYHEVERRAYQPQWFQHEFMHHVYRTWPEFGLEERGHQWFSRSSWPADFEGAWEPDYYAESITKRLLNASPSLAEGLKAPKGIDFDINDPDLLVGHYERRPVQNKWHEVEIVLSDGALRWQNAAGVSWSLQIVDGDLWAGSDCPYGSQKLSVTTGSDQEITSVYFNGEAYLRIN